MKLVAGTKFGSYETRSLFGKGIVDGLWIELPFRVPAAHSHVVYGVVEAGEKSKGRFNVLTGFGLSRRSVSPLKRAVDQFATLPRRKRRGYAGKASKRGSTNTV